MADRGNVVAWPQRRVETTAVNEKSNGTTGAVPVRGPVTVRLPRVWAVGAAVDEMAAREEVKARVGRGGLRLVAGAERAAGEAAAAVLPDPAVRAAGEELRFYRKYTEAMLRRYGQMRLASGRVPSLLGRELFGAGRASSSRQHGFDDAVIFCHDVERAMGTLDPADARLLQRVAVQGFTQGEAAGALGWSLRTVVTRYGRALDGLTAVLLERRLLEPLRVC